MNAIVGQWPKVLQKQKINPKMGLNFCLKNYYNFGYIWCNFEKFSVLQPY